MSPFDWPTSWSVGVRARIDRQGRTVLGPDEANLLEAIGRHRSITAAAKDVGLSYRQAWNNVQRVNDASGAALVAAAPGGLRGGGASLTDQGAQALAAYRVLQTAVERRAGQVLGELIAPAAGAVVRVAAAISFQEALGQILAAFALYRPAVRARSTFGASNELAAQIRAGAPCDVFISADARHVDELAAAGRLAADSKRAVALNSLALIGPRGARRLRAADLASTAVSRVALAEPSCPLGEYTKRYLESAGLYDRVQPKAVEVDNSRAVLAAVVSGVAEVGVAFLSDAQRSEDCDILARIARAKMSAVYVAAAAPDGEGARELLDFLGTPTAHDCLRRCGLRRP